MQAHVHQCDMQLNELIKLVQQFKNLKFQLAHDV